MKRGTKAREEDIIKVDIYNGSFRNPQKEKQSPEDDLERIEQERRSNLN